MSQIYIPERNNGAHPLNDLSALKYTLFAFFGM